MQIIAVAIWRVLRWKIWKQILGFSIKMSLNDVCVFIPAWFGSIATVILGLLTHEVSGSWRAGVASSLIMSVIPAHLMRSVGGGFDNESVAMTAMVLTFYLWVRSLRTEGSWFIGVLAGLAYVYMVAAWGGFIFVGNLVGVHAAFLVASGYYSSCLHKAYSLFFIVGTYGATLVPVVGMSPFRSLEQIGPLLVFFGLQFLAICDAYGASKGYTWKANPREMLTIRTHFAGAVGVVGAAFLAYLVPTGYFGPLSARVRSLFIKHTRTGNPLVDSVAEHQPASAEAYWHHLHLTIYLFPVGVFLASLIGATDKNRQYAGLQVTKWFIVLYGIIAYYFSSKMNRLIILLGPVSSSLSGIVIAFFFDWAVEQLMSAQTVLETLASKGISGFDEEPTTPAASSDDKSKDKKSKKKDETAASQHVLAAYGLSPFIPVYDSALALYGSGSVRIVRILTACLFFVALAQSSLNFYKFSDNYARQMSHPSIMFKARLSDGSEVMINDYQEAYWWLRDHTPTDSRVLSWWDYGYQIAGIGNRTTLADGNTWNLEHIALIGRILTANEKKAHSLARHLADYVLIWGGNQGDDLAKSPHMARISNSVYADVCPNDPLCRSFGFYGDKNKPTPSMAASMLYKMHSAGRAPGVTVNPELFKEVYSSKYGLVRIYKILNISQESKDFSADPANRICDRPGSWYCVGQYPPGLPKPPKTHRNLDYEDATKFVEEKQK
jgi:dolichyl-diphosphooligosaccharide---protein glycosyltransferase